MEMNEEVKWVGTKNFGADSQSRLAKCDLECLGVSSHRGAVDDFSYDFYCGSFFSGTTL